MFILELSASKIALIQNEFNETVLPSTQAKENLTFTWIHFILIFLQNNSLDIQNVSGLIESNGTEMLQGIGVSYYWGVLN